MLYVEVTQANRHRARRVARCNVKLTTLDDSSVYVNCGMKNANCIVDMSELYFKTRQNYQFSTPSST